MIARLRGEVSCAPRSCLLIIAGRLPSTPAKIFTSNRRTAMPFKPSLEKFDFDSRLESGSACFGVIIDRVSPAR
jgi:hypothetical protein